VTEAPTQFPTATYRLQLSSHLRFEDVGNLADYLADLGIGAAYLSPFFRASQGSTHGYDVVDHHQLDPKLGDEQDFAAMAKRVRAAGLGVMVDVVPNHMGIDDPHNSWWQDVLENGPGSMYAKYFDIDWSPPKEALRGKVLLPVLGDQFGKVLEDQQLRLAYENQRLFIRYYERSFPTDPQTWVPLLKQALEDFVAPRLAVDVPERMELESIITALEHLPPRNELSAEIVQQRYRENEVARRRLYALVESSEEVRQGLDQTISDYNGRRGETASFDKLESLVTQQPYRLCYWRVATDEINYRRFFDVDALAAIRVEDPEVFAAVHETLLGYVAKDWVTALRIDHADGLLDPQQYLANLAQAVRQAKGDDPAASPKPNCLLYTLVEKILGHDETLPADWPVHGTTGYDFLNLLGGIFVDRLGAYSLREVYRRFLGQLDPFSEVLYESKRIILATSLSAELYMLSHQLDQLSEQHRWSRDFTRLSLFRALREVVACFPVYRAYIRPELGEVGDDDRRRIQEALRTAKRRNPAMSPTFFDFIGSVLLLEEPHGLSDDAIQERRQFVSKFQQFTGPVTAKGLEDTAFYRYFPLASLNEVGGNPAMPGVSIEQFHRRIQEQASSWPHTMLTTGTHDTKRGEDVRARLNVLSEVPQEWEAAVRRWQEMNVAARCELDGAAVPDANEEYLIFQTLVGTWPLARLDEAGWQEYVARIVEYLDKALREAKLHTSWLNPYDEYDLGVANFIRAILANRDAPFAQDMDAFSRSIADAGFVNSLAQTLIKMSAPGVPDFYQGVEFWDFNLVDPDNRRPVDFAVRREALCELRRRAGRDVGSLAAELVGVWPDPRLKMWLIWRTLEFRREHWQLFERSYLPVFSEGPRKGNVCAFARIDAPSWALCVVPRFVQEAWRDTRQGDSRGKGRTWTLADWWDETLVLLPAEAPRRWRHVLTGDVIESVESAEGGRTLDVGQVLRSFPVALLAGEEV
jgi:(1->4)-alpha-D-glucan 1-alpha-D-glucosylmutase